MVFGGHLPNPQQPLRETVALAAAPGLRPHACALLRGPVSGLLSASPVQGWPTRACSSYAERHHGVLVVNACLSSWAAECLCTVLPEEPFSSLGRMPRWGPGVACPPLGKQAVSPEDGLRLLGGGCGLASAAEPGVATEVAGPQQDSVTRRASQVTLGGFFSQ